MEKDLQTFIISKVSKQYLKMHRIVEVTAYSDHKIEVVADLFYYRNYEMGVKVKPSPDYIEVIGIKQMVRDYKLQTLLSYDK
jgi:hypothetical protein